MVRTVTGASASYSLQAIFPLSVSNVQYRPGFRLSAGAAVEMAARLESIKTNANVILRDIAGFHPFFAKDDRTGNFSCQGESAAGSGPVSDNAPFIRMWDRSKAE